jgi:hypothetical protein
MDSPAATLTHLRNELLRLHKVLLESERSIYERDIARIESPGQFLGLLMEDPWFAYLRELSGLVVQIDERIDDKKRPPEVADAVGYVARAKALLLPSETGTGFEKRYFEALQRDPDVVMAHAAATRVINGLKAA